MLDISCESSARQRIHMEHQALFASKDKSKKNKVSSAAIFVWPLRGSECRLILSIYGRVLCEKT